MDALHGFAGVPISGLTQLSEEVPATLLAYTAQELDEILAQYPAYSIPAGTYLGKAAAEETFVVKCLLCVNADMHEELVYQITKALAEMELTTEVRELMGEMEQIAG